MFNDVRAKGYAELRKSLQGFIGRRKKNGRGSRSCRTGTPHQQFRGIREVDFFDNARGHDVLMLLRRAEGRGHARQLAVLGAKQYQG
jgi:hypothetical protein